MSPRSNRVSSLLTVLHRLFFRPPLHRLFLDLVQGDVTKFRTGNMFPAVLAWPQPLSATPRAWGRAAGAEGVTATCRGSRGLEELGHFCFSNLECIHSRGRAQSQSPPPHSQAEKKALHLMEIKGHFWRATSNIRLGSAACKKVKQPQGAFLPPVRSGANMEASDHPSLPSCGKIRTRLQTVHYN